MWISTMSKPKVAGKQNSCTCVFVSYIKATAGMKSWKLPWAFCSVLTKLTWLQTSAVLYSMYDIVCLMSSLTKMHPIHMYSGD